MKARVKATGVIIEVDNASDGMYYQSECGRTISDYSADELEFIPTPQKQSAIIEGWVARDEDGRIYSYTVRPFRIHDEDLDSAIWDVRVEQPCKCLELPTTAFPDLKWKDEPRKVKLTIE